MYSEYTALFTHSTQRTCAVSYIIYTLYNVHIGSQLYLGIILHYIQNVCKNKCAVCAMYSVHIAYIAHRAYILYMRVAQYAFLFTLAGPTHFARISKITTHQIRNVNVCKCCE